MGRRLRRLARAIVAPLIFLTLSAYFLRGATRGDHGLDAHVARQALLASARADLSRAEADRDRWEIKVSGLRAQHLDRDALDERARAMLNRSAPADVIVNYPPRERLF